MFPGTILKVMNKHAQNKFKMYKDVVGTCTENAAVMGNVAVFGTTLNAVKQKMVILETIAAEQASMLMGVKNEKESKRKETAEKAETLGGFLTSYALGANDEVLLASLRFFPSILNHASALKMMQLLDRIIAASNQHLSDLAVYGITQSDVTQLETLRAEMDVLFAAVRKAIGDRKARTGEIDAVVKEIDKLLGQMDNMVLSVKSSNAFFYTRYQSARAIVDYQGKKKNPLHPLDTPPELPSPPQGSK